MITRRFGLFLLLLFELFPYVACQISVVNGQRVYSATPVQTSPNGAPTLIYNCAKMPAICENINRRNPMTRRANGGLGEIVGGEIELHFDTDATRKERRNNEICPSSWVSNHQCPETNPAQPHTVPRGAMLGSGSYPARPFNRQGLTIGMTGYNRIGDAAGNDAGMIWSCDEFPMASTIEGGAGNARSYCAPISSKCAQGNYQRSEQNFQSDAQSTLRQRAAIGNVPDPTRAVGIFAFRLKTVWFDDIDEAATSIEFYADANTGLVDRYSRDLRFESDDEDEPLYHVTERFHENGTTSQTYRRLTNEQVSCQSLPLTFFT
jgi:hypothetical protein